MALPCVLTMDPRMETRRLAVQLTHVWILFEGFFTVGRKLARQAVLTELFQTLKVIDVTVIGGLADLCRMLIAVSKTVLVSVCTPSGSHSLWHERPARLQTTILS